MVATGPGQNRRAEARHFRIHGRVCYRRAVLAIARPQWPIPAKTLRVEPLEPEIDALGRHRGALEDAIIGPTVRRV